MFFACFLIIMASVRCEEARSKNLFGFLASSLRILSPIWHDDESRQRRKIEVISTWGVQNKIDFLSRSYTRHAEDVHQVGSDAILLGAETHRGLYPVDRICFEAERVFNQDQYFKKAVKYVGEPISHLESIGSSAVRVALKIKASVIICFTSSGRAARLLAKYRPPMPILSVVIPRLKTNQLKWSFSGVFEAESTSATNETILKVALDHGKALGIIKSYDRVVICQKLGDSFVVKIIKLED